MASQLPDVLPDLVSSLDVDAEGWLVEDQERRVVKQDARDPSGG